MSDIPQTPALSPAASSAPSTPVSAPPSTRAFETRIWSAFTLLLSLGMLTIGAILTPSPDGFGKHAGLFGMPPCGMYQTTGIPCPTCGCTTAVAHFSHGHFLTSFLTQPFGFAVAIFALLAVPLTANSLITGRWRGPSLFSFQWYWRYWVYGSIAIFILGWIYKIIIVTTHP